MSFILGGLLRVVKVFEGTDSEYYMDGYLVSNLDLAKRVNKDDWDFLFLVDGKERGGKSVFAQQIGLYVYPDLSVDDIAFSPKDFERKVRLSKPNSCVIYDEAYGGLSSRNFMSWINKSLVKMLTEIGFKNLFIIIVLPSFFDLDKYVALWRSRALFHIYTSDNLERGFFGAYNDESKKKLYLFGKKFYDYGVISPDFRGRFTNHYVVPEKDYKAKKKEASDKAINTSAFTESELDDALFQKVMGNDKLTHNDRMKALGIPEATYFRKLRVWKSENY